MPVITEEGFDTLQESVIQEDPSVVQQTNTDQKKKSEPDSESGQPEVLAEADSLDTEAKAELAEAAEPVTVKPAVTTIVSAKRDSDPLQDDDEDDDDDFDETLAERLWGLTEMFPDSVRDLATNLVDMSAALAKNGYQFSCNAAWVVASSATILVLPVMFELERAQMEQQQLQQQRQILLGPNAAASGPGPAMPGPPR